MATIQISNEMAQPFMMSSPIFRPARIEVTRGDPLLRDGYRALHRGWGARQIKGSITARPLLR